MCVKVIIYSYHYTSLFEPLHCAIIVLIYKSFTFTMHSSLLV